MNLVYAQTRVLKLRSSNVATANMLVSSVTTSAMPWVIIALIISDHLCQRGMTEGLPVLLLYFKSVFSSYT